MGGKSGSGSRRLGGRKEAQLQEPPDHALGRSRGGFGTKVHLVCDRHGFIVAIHVTAGQAHESKALEPTMARRLFHRRYRLHCHGLSVHSSREADFLRRVLVQVCFVTFQGVNVLTYHQSVFGSFLHAHS